MRTLAKIPAFFMGLLIGGVVGVLFAPRKGAITRAQIKNKIDEDKERLLEKKIDLEQRKKELLRRSQNQLFMAKNMIQKKGE